MAALTTPTTYYQTVVGNWSFYVYPFESVADGDTFTIPEPNTAAIIGYWMQSHHSDVVTQSVNIASGDATFQMGATAPATLFILAAAR